MLFVLKPKYFSHFISLLSAATVHNVAEHNVNVTKREWTKRTSSTTKHVTEYQFTKLKCDRKRAVHYQTSKFQNA